MPDFYKYDVFPDQFPQKPFLFLTSNFKN